MQFCIAELWNMYDKENKDKITHNLKLGEENFRVIEEKRKMEEPVHLKKLERNGNERDNMINIACGC